MLGNQTGKGNSRSICSWWRVQAGMDDVDYRASGKTLCGTCPCCDGLPLCVYCPNLIVVCSYEIIFDFHMLIDIIWCLLLAVVNNTMNHYRSLGGFTYEFADYVAAGVITPATMQTEQYKKLMNIVDPLSYFGAKPAWLETDALRNFRAIPKMVVDGGNDEFMLPDDNHQWWGQLHGEKHLLHIANVSEDRSCDSV